MIATSSLLARLGKRFPKRMAKKYNDYVGLMVGKFPKTISRVYLTLDLEPSNAAEIKSFKPDVIITHHPFVYGKRKDIAKNDPGKAAFIRDIEKMGIPVYSMHTNFDEGRGGMNDALTEKLGLLDIKPLIADPMARGGRLPYPMAIHDFAAYAKKALGAEYGLLLEGAKKMIATVAIVGGGGSFVFKAAKDEGYDIFISGDAPHHVRRTILTEKYNYLDLPHEIESIFLQQMEKLLLEIDPSLDILKAPLESQARVI